jgi:hypothetical protein
MTTLTLKLQFQQFTECQRLQRVAVDGERRSRNAHQLLPMTLSHCRAVEIIDKRNVSLSDQRACSIHSIQLKNKTLTFVKLFSSADELVRLPRKSSESRLVNDVPLVSML